MTQLEMARKGQISDLVRQAAQTEGIDAELLRQKIAAGTAVICLNNKHKGGKPLAVGEGLRTKTNANIGTSQDDTSIDKELEKRVPVVLQGGYIPHVDHGVPPDVSWDNFCYYRHKLDSMLDEYDKKRWETIE